MQTMHMHISLCIRRCNELFYSFKYRGSFGLDLILIIIIFWLDVEFVDNYFSLKLR